MDSTKDPMLRHPIHGPSILEIRKQLAFKGWTFKAPQTSGGITRLGEVAFLSSDADSQRSRESSKTIIAHWHEAAERGLGLAGEEGIGIGTIGSTTRSRAMSF